MRKIDADALVEILTTAIRNMQGVAKFIGAEDDPEIKMEIKAYTDILGGVKEQPTIEERKKGKWIHHDGGYSDHYECTACGRDTVLTEGKWRYCPNCGAKMEETE